MTKLTAVMGAVALLGVLAGCERSLILTGQRFSIDTPLEDTVAAETGAYVPPVDETPNRSAPVALGAAVANGEWGHRSGSASRAMPHVAFAAQPRQIWAASIGTGDSRRRRIATAPVVGGGMVFAMDSANRLTALSAANGGQVWSMDITPEGERSDGAGGGGITYAGGRLYVGTGFGEVIAIDPARGTPIWRQRFDGPVPGAPAVVGGTVYVSGRDAGWAIDAASGKLKWTQSGVRDNSGMVGGLAPAISGNRVVMPWSSGQIIALDPGTGTPVWTGAVVGQRAGRAAAFVGDVTGDPVISGGKVYVGNSLGRTAAFNLANGAPLWEAREGAMNAVAPVGNAVFLVNDEGYLVRLDAASGETVWSVPMGHFTRDRPKRQLSVTAHYGPVLAGGRLVVASGDDQIRFFSPESGAPLGSIPLPGGAASAPAFAGGTMYVTTSNGQVVAFR